MPKRSSARAAVLHPVPIASVDRLTDDSVLIRFDVPEDLRDQFSFEPGQHITVRTDLGGEGVRRNYSICSSATSDTLAIAVKHIPGGSFSTFAMEQLRAGDTLDLMTPTGSFGTPLSPLATKNYVAIVAAAGSPPRSRSCRRRSPSRPRVASRWSTATGTGAARCSASS